MPVSGNLLGLKPAQRHALERIGRRAVPPGEVVSAELATFMARVSSDLRRQIGVLIDRRGKVEHIVVGDAERLVLPDLGRQRAGQSRLRGVRLVHTHLLGERLTTDDLTDLTKLQLDLVGALQAAPDGSATTLEIAWLVPPSPGGGEPWQVRPPEALHRFELDFERFIDELEGRFTTVRGTVREVRDGGTRAIVVHVTPHAATHPEVAWREAELAELCRTAGITIVETMMQRRPEPDPRFVVGRGKLQELALAAIRHDADLVIFDRELSPSQARSIAESVELKVIDRTQLILDIFAQRARSLDGKLQVELAQLVYTLPRLSGKGVAMSRLMGGIGGRGPGETKLEIDRRRAKERIGLLRARIVELGRQRAQRRARRVERRIPVAAIVGYTNAGKSTLLNTLTGAGVLAEDKLFATLDPTAKRLVLAPAGETPRAIVATDTVGFIRDLPADLMAAFKATLEELADADVLVHVVDVSEPGWEERRDAVERILRELEVHHLPTILVMNKLDRLESRAQGEALCRRDGAVGVSAIERASLAPLLERLAAMTRADESVAAGEPAT
ncbi:MAG: GTPase HflX [Deltaproteobacteria bacterium]|nr:GTPase HflX [Deltaproteobacteria bacterium]